MASEQLTAWCAAPVALGPAELPDHRLAFLRRSIRWQGGAADIVPSPGASVWGVLWELPLGLGELDAKEAAGDAYRRRAAEVLLAGGEPRLAAVYEVIAKEPDEVPPTPAYLAAMVGGALEHGLPDDYVELIRAVRPH